jgi:hypothetical protein
VFRRTTESHTRTRSAFRQSQLSKFSAKLPSPTLQSKLVIPNCAQMFRQLYTNSVWKSNIWVLMKLSFPSSKNEHPLFGQMFNTAPLGARRVLVRRCRYNEQGPPFESSRRKLPLHMQEINTVRKWQSEVQVKICPNISQAPCHEDDLKCVITIIIINIIIIINQIFGWWNWK